MKQILHTNKGFTVIELVIATSLFLVLCSIILKQFVVNVFNFKSEITSVNENISSISAIDNLGELLSEADPNSTSVNSNIITYCYKGLKREILIEKNYSNKEDLVLNYYGITGSRVTKKYIVKELSNFSVREKGKIIYINFEKDKGGGYNKCLVKK